MRSINIFNLATSAIFLLKITLADESEIPVKSNRCLDGYYGDNCNQFCEGCINNDCDNEGGCTLGCQDGFSSDENSNQCNPVCFDDQGCSNGGFCVAPNHCICGKTGAQTSQMSVKYNGVYGKDCISLRKHGLKGFLAAVFMLLLSIGTCGYAAPRTQKTEFRTRQMPFLSRIFILVVVGSLIYVALGRFMNMWNRADLGFDV